MRVIILIFKGIRRALKLFVAPWFTYVAKVVFTLNGAAYGQNMNVNGLIKVFVTRRGLMTVGANFRLNSGESFNMIGRQQKCIFWVEGELIIKDNVGMSSSAIVCNHQITIGNNVMIGGNTVIYDTDFHSLEAAQRRNPTVDRINARWAPVVIEDNVFIGAHSTILKGVTIGENSVIGACSVVSKSVPANEIWAGNPAAFIRNCPGTPAHAKEIERRPFE